MGSRAMSIEVSIKVDGTVSTLSFAKNEGSKRE